MWFVFSNTFSNIEYNTLIACTTSAILSSIITSMTINTLYTIFVRVIIIVLLTICVCYTMVLSDNTKSDIKQRIRTTIKHFSNLSDDEIHTKKNIFS